MACATAIDNSLYVFRSSAVSVARLAVEDNVRYPVPRPLFSFTDNTQFADFLNFSGEDFHDPRPERLELGSGALLYAVNTYSSLFWSDEACSWRTNGLTHTKLDLDFSKLSDLHDRSDAFPLRKEAHTRSDRGWSSASPKQPDRMRIPKVQYVSPAECSSLQTEFHTADQIPCAKLSSAARQLWPFDEDISSEPDSPKLPTSRLGSPFSEENFSSEDDSNEEVSQSDDSTECTENIDGQDSSSTEHGFKHLQMNTSREPVQVATETTSQTYSPRKSLSPTHRTESIYPNACNPSAATPASSQAPVLLLKTTKKNTPSKRPNFPQQVVEPLRMWFVQKCMEVLHAETDIDKVKAEEDDKERLVQMLTMPPTQIVRWISNNRKRALMPNIKEAVKLVQMYHGKNTFRKSKHLLIYSGA